MPVYSLLALALALALQPQVGLTPALSGRSVTNRSQGSARCTSLEAAHPGFTSSEGAGGWSAQVSAWPVDGKEDTGKASRQDC